MVAQPCYADDHFNKAIQCKQRPLTNFQCQGYTVYRAIDRTSKKHGNWVWFLL